MGTLFVVATPIGNLADLSERAGATLRAVPVVLAEDTRHTRGLLAHLDAHPRLVSLHAHNERARLAAALALLAAGDAALVTDAGTPAVSDPGARLVDAAAGAGHRVVPIPGPSALSTALSAAGFSDGAGAGVLFLGFPPSHGTARREALARAAAFAGIVVLFEAPQRLAEALSSLAAAAPERRGCVARELSKVHEELRRGTLAALRDWAAAEIRGEIVIVLGPWQVTTDATTLAAATIDGALARCRDAGLSGRDAVAAVAAVLELPRRQVYQRALAAQEAVETPRGATTVRRPR